MFRNTMPRYEILSPDAMQTLDRGWRRIVSEIGIEFILPEAVEIFRARRLPDRGRDVYLDPEFVMEQVAKAPREFDLIARNPRAQSVHVGGDAMAFGAVYGLPVRARGRRAAGRRPWPTSRTSSGSSQSFDQLDTPGGTICEPNDRPLDSRHLDMVYALQTLSDKVHMGSVTSGANAEDTIRMCEIVHGGREAIERSPVVISLINVNSPLRYDDRMLAAMLEYVRAGQPVVITPFLLMGAMSPVTVPAALVQQMAEALAGIALAQIVRPGCPVVLRVVPVQHRPAVGLAQLRHARVGAGPALHRPDRAPVRAPVALGRRPHRQPDGRRAGGLRGADDDAADVPGRRQLRHARRRLAGVRAGQLLREVHRRHRDPAHAPGGVHAARGRRG